MKRFFMLLATILLIAFVSCSGAGSGDGGVDMEDEEVYNLVTLTQLYNNNIRTFNDGYYTIEEDSEHEKVLCHNGTNYFSADAVDTGWNLGGRALYRKGNERIIKVVYLGDDFTPHTTPPSTKKENELNIQFDLTW